ncbi:hypothetical protein JYU34_018117 [Plutella xylostella]|uniref:ARID domain-containing protein n=2 Tax=Plutella xylostella TaxID=51655 RepID=A0ABQ7Q0L8_PLUXY|nr:hypothetical protein JYU34_018117 [Plutella xylostella]
MDKPSIKLVGAPCGQHGQYTFYKALRVCGADERILAIGDFFFVRIWQDSELVSIGELQLLWTDRVSDQTLVSLRLYFLPENTPDGRNGHGEDEVLAINDKVVLRADDLLSWLCDGGDWRWGLRAVWRGACAPPAEGDATAPLHKTKMDFSDVDKEKSAIPVDPSRAGVVVFSYGRYCRYRALLSRLEGLQADWLRQALVAALGGYAAPTSNTCILYCKDTFEYPELEGHELICNQLAPRLKGRPRRRRRRARSLSHSSESADSGSETQNRYTHTQPSNQRRPSLRNGKQATSTEEEEDISVPADEEADRAFLRQLRAFYKSRNESFKKAASLKDLSLRALYLSVRRRGGYAAVCRRRGWRSLHDALQPTAPHPHHLTKTYERFLLSYETHERRNGTKYLSVNGKPKKDSTPIDTIDVTESPLRETKTKPDPPQDKRLRTPSPKPEVSFNSETGETEVKDLSKPAEELNKEFLDSLPKDEKKDKDAPKISVKPVETLLENNLAEYFKSSEVVKSLAADNSALIAELANKYNLKDSTKILEEIANKKLSDGSNLFLNELAMKLNLGHPDSTGASDLSRRAAHAASNGHADTDNSEKRSVARNAQRSSLRSVRVKPAREARAFNTTTPSLRPDSASSSPPVSSSTPRTNFGIAYPPPPAHGHVSSTNSHEDDDEIVEVPYKPKTPEIIDLDEYPESPQSVKKKKLDILKERGLEVTAIPSNWTPAVVPMLNPAMQHQLLTNPMFQMYSIMPSFANGAQPPPKVIQGMSVFGSSGTEKTVYGNPKDPFMPPPHILQGTPIKPPRAPPVSSSPQPPAKDIMDLSKPQGPSPQKPAVEIVRVPNIPSPSKNVPQNLSAKNYTLIDGKAVVGSNLEITLVNPKSQTPVKNRPPQKRSSNGKFTSAKTPTPPKEGYPKAYASPSPSGVQKDRKPNIIIPNYQINSTRDDPSPTGSTGSRDSQSSLLQNSLLNAYKGQNNLAQLMEMQAKSAVPALSPFMDPMYMSALYSSLAGQMDQRQMALYRDFMASQVRGFPGLLNMGAIANTPTTKN